MLLVGCVEQPSPPEIRNGVSVREACPDSSNDTYYFPENMLVPPVDRPRDWPRSPEEWTQLAARFDRDERKAVNGLYSALAAPSLSCGPATSEAFRTVWFPTWGQPVVASITSVGDG